MTDLQRHIMDLLRCSPFLNAKRLKPAANPNQRKRIKQRSVKIMMSRQEVTVCRMPQDDKKPLLLHSTAGQMLVSAAAAAAAHMDPRLSRAIGRKDIPLPLLFTFTRFLLAMPDTFSCCRPQA